VSYRYTPQPAIDPASLPGHVHAYCEYLKAKNYAEQSIAYQAMALRAFVAWAHERGLHRPTEVTRPILMRYQRHVAYALTTKGKPLGIQSQCNRITSVRRFFRYLTLQNVLLYNPAADLELPKRPHRLPKHTLTAEEAERVLSQPDLDDPLGVRDRAILEVLYSTGMRRMELVNLRRGDLDHARGVVAVRMGKGQKDRFIPIGERALAWVEKYLADVRPLYEIDDRDTLFLTWRGHRLDKHWLGHNVRRYIERAAVDKVGSCHLFRHTCATLMLENGADIRYIQRLLGHALLSTTEIYTHVSIGKLKHIHNLTHPAQMPDAMRKHGDVDADHVDAGDQPPRAITPREPTAADVLAVLAAEADEDERDDAPDAA